jgi:glycosyltransferase involved in cell wall biosynthesis
VTGIPEVVRDGETGLLVPQNDTAALAAGLERLLEDPSLRLTLAARARRRIEEDFDARRNSARLRQVLLEVRTGRTGAALAAARAG